jgi:hypothetical protein
VTAKRRLACALVLTGPLYLFILEPSGCIRALAALRTPTPVEVTPEALKAQNAPIEKHLTPAGSEDASKSPPAPISAATP